MTAANEVALFRHAKTCHHEAGFVVRAKSDDPVSAGAGSVPEQVAASAAMVKCAGTVVRDGLDPAFVHTLLTLRLSISADQQKPVQMEPELNGVGTSTPERSSRPTARPAWPTGSPTRSSSCTAWSSACRGGRRRAARPGDHGRPTRSDRGARLPQERLEGGLTPL